MTTRAKPADPAPAEPAPAAEPESLVETVRKVVAEALGQLFDSGKATVSDTQAGGESRTWTAREIQEMSAGEMRRAQEELKARRQRKAGAGDAPSGAGAAGQTPAPGNAPPTPAPEPPPRNRRRLGGEGGLLWGAK